jgi:flagellar basal body-associated protein FliL
MAAETAQQSEVSPGGEASAGAAAAPKAGGLKSYLPLIIAIVLMPVAAYVTMMVLKPNAEKGETSAKPSAKPKDAHAQPVVAKDSHGGGGHGASKSGSHDAEGGGASVDTKRPPRLPVPLTREVIGYKPPDAKKENDFGKIVVLDIKGEPKDLAQPDKLVVNVANTGGRGYAVARFSVVGSDPDLIKKMNENRERLLDRATGTLSSKTMEEIEKPVFKNMLRAELLTLFSQTLGISIQEVIITDFATQQ